MEETIIELDKIKVYRNRQPVLDIENLVIGAGELVAVSGANGAGKSTLLQVINLLLPYQQGMLTLFGRDTAKNGPETVRRYSSMMFQETLLVNGTVYDNVALPLKFRGYSPAQIEEQVREALTTFHCQHLAKRQANQLSGGEAQRVGLARALVFQPQLLLLDEPFAALDTASRTAILTDLKQVATLHKLTVLLVSHNFNDVLYFADRVVVLEGGRIIQDACPEVVLRRPATATVANLVDMDNILPCQVEHCGRELVVRLPGGVEFKHNTLPPPRATACCLPGDALYILNESSLLRRQPLITAKGKVVGIIPGVGAYKIRIETGCLSLLVRVPREQTIGLTLGSNVEVAFNPEEVQLV
ncbi:Spermidine/putrescine import ATP-binding protein PotA [uncultured Sporomusa sp.]|uniref:Spermidine/putrescine import ATP-binding protein PotA n=1 Tax=uncultured Sporomusa sp. TaxID=307249 RepID=A0A212LTF6_9FIRM|nr:ABC transporter ATP-binding protein [uncultured Sporomusa sp.]SCM80740.1 Spermidine/putrescine import ATP-binding protein PotA [uncultured Sporomusa sp.]